jgi:signal peptidase I
MLAAAPTTPRARRASGAWPLRRVAVTLVALLLAAGLWVTVAPQQMGGPAAYVITDGISMLPEYHTGDLVVVHREPSYQVGEVAAFHDQQLHAVVLHRIVAIRGNRYVFKGDNNPVDTPYEPTRSQIVGAQWVHVPGAGNVVLDLRRPIVAAVLLGLLALYSFSPAARSRRRRRRHRHAR